MVPIVLLQTLRYFITIDDHGDSWLVYSIKAFSLLFIGKSLLLTILFPALKISNIKGKYNVGIVDLHLPVDNFVQNYVHVRFLYPTLEKSTRIPYLDTDMGAKICKTLIEIGAPPPLNKLGFLLNHWRLSTVQGKRNANPFVPIRENDESGSKLLPIVVYSHGLTASAELYSYQTMSLAANGAFVMSITHSDASAIAVKRKDGSFLGYDPHIANLAKEKETLLESVRSRRRQVEYRANEVLAAIEALLELSKRNIQELNDVGISFVNKLDVKDITMMGHSFGGATALSVANMRPDLFTCCVAHDPAVDWCTDGKIFIFYVMI
jgi:platelet-activating factor acetylhydrolase